MNSDGHDSLHVSEAIETMRLCLTLGDNAGASTVFRKELFPRCVRWVQSGRHIPWQDAQDIAARAIEHVMDDLRSPLVSPEQVSLNLKSKLNTFRAEYRRTVRFEQSFGDFEAYEVAFRLYKEADVTGEYGRESEYARREDHLLKIVAKLHGFLGIALEQLRPRDRAILLDLYGLHEIGLSKPAEPSPLPSLSAGARRVATHRARQQFLEKLVESLSQACNELKDEAKVLEDLIKLIEAGHLADVLALDRRQQPN